MPSLVHALVLARGNGLHLGRMAHGKLLGVRLQGVVDPRTEQRRFHRTMPATFPSCRPAPQRRTLRYKSAFLHNLAGGCLYAKTVTFLVYVESDIVNSIHGVLLIEISESPAANSRSQQCNLEENPFSLPNNPFQPLYIQTDSLTPIRNAVQFRELQNPWEDLRSF